MIGQRTFITRAPASSADAAGGARRSPPPATTWSRRSAHGSARRRWSPRNDGLAAHATERCMSERPWLRRPSALARQALVLYAALIVYGSWYPFSGWRSLGLAPFAYLFDPMPQYLTAFDVVTNVLGYMPFGALVVLARLSALARPAGGRAGLRARRPAVGRDGSGANLSADARRVQPRSRRQRARRAARRRDHVARDRRAARSRLAATFAASVVRARSRGARVPGRRMAVRDDVPGAAPVRSRQLAARAVAAIRSDDAGRAARVDAAGLARRRMAGAGRRVAARRRVGSLDHHAQPVRRARAGVAAGAPPRAVRAAAAAVCRRDLVREGGRDVPAIAVGPCVRLGDARRARGARVRHRCRARSRCICARGRVRRSRA